MNKIASLGLTLRGETDLTNDLQIMRMLWLISREGAFRSKGRGFESCSSRHVGTLSKSLTHNWENQKSEGHRAGGVLLYVKSSFNAVER